MKKLKVQLEDGTEAVLTVEGMIVHGMQFDGMDEIEGVREIRRASHVEFDIETQMWTAEICPRYHRLDTKKHYYEHKRRSECIAWERRYLNGEEIEC